VKFNHTSLAAGVVFIALAAGMFSLGTGSRLTGPVAAEAQNLGMRVVSGFVTDGHSVPVVGATVFLRDVKSKTIRSYTSTEMGKFRFAGVKMDEDHEMWAEDHGRKSAVKTISSWDARKEFQVELKLK
jgi:hypothetical protein